MVGINLNFLFHRNLAAAGGFLNSFGPSYPQTAPSSESPSSQFSQFYSGFHANNAKETTDKIRVPTTS